MDLSIVVPCYNEQGNVKVFYETIVKTFKNIKINYEIIFVNDGSNDDTYKELNLLLKEKGNIKVIHFSRNFGKEAAMLAGLKSVQGALTTIIDADLQQDPKIILKMIDILDNNEEIDCVAACQEKRKEGKLLSFFKSSFYGIINKMTGLPFKQGASDFRTFRRNMINAILEFGECHRFSKGLFSYVGFNTKYIPYQVLERQNGTSKWSFKKLFNYAIEGIISFTVSPLRIAFHLSFILIFITLIAFITFIFTGFNSFNLLLMVILFLAGTQFLILGIIGEYLSKTYIQGKNRPIYIIKEMKESGNNEMDN